MDPIDKAQHSKRVKVPSRSGEMFRNRRPISLDTLDYTHCRRHSDGDSVFEVVGHQSAKDLFEHVAKGTKVLPPIQDESRVNKTRVSSNTTLILGSDTVLYNGEEHSSNHGQETSHHQFLQTQGYVPGVDSHVTIRQPYVMQNGMKPTITNAFQRTASETNGESLEESDRTGDKNKTRKASVSKQTHADTDMSDSEYVISTFPPIGKDEISKHAQLNKEAEKNSKNKPHAYQEYLRKLQVQKRLLDKPKPGDQKSIKRKNKKLQLKTRLRDTREDLLADKPETPPKPKEETVKPMKVIQSFRYSRAIAEYYKGQMDSKHSVISFDGDPVNHEDDDEVKNGWLVKSLGPQVLNLCSRSLPSCNPIELRLRRQYARQRALEHGKLSKRSSTLSQSSSRKLSRSHDSFTSLYHGHDPDHTITGEEMSSTDSPNKSRFLPDIPEAQIEKDYEKHVKSGVDSTGSKTTKIVLSLPLLSSEA